MFTFFNCAAGGTNIRVHAKRLVASVRAFANSTLLQYLSVERTEEEKMSILNDFFTRYEEDVIANPSEHDTPFDMFYVYICKERVWLIWIDCKKIQKKNIIYVDLFISRNIIYVDLFISGR